MGFLDEIKKVGANVDVYAGVRVFIGRKAGRYIGEFLDGVGDDNILVCMQERKWMTDLLPPEKKAGLIKLAAQYRKEIDAFPDEEVYSWIPQDKRVYYESIEGGKEYLLGQIAEIRRLIKAAPAHPPLPNQVKAHRIS